MKLTQTLTRNECEDLYEKLNDHSCCEECNCQSGYMTEAAKLFMSILNKKSIFKEQIDFSFDEINDLRNLNKLIIEDVFKHFTKLSVVKAVIDKIEWTKSYSTNLTETSAILYNENYIAIPLSKYSNNDWFVDAYEVVKIIIDSFERSIIYPNSLSWVNQIHSELNTEDKYDYILIGLGLDS